jgi:hypothetical protein
MNNLGVFLKKLLQMLIIVGLLLCFEQVDAFGSFINNDDFDNKTGKQFVIPTTDDVIPGPINDIPQQIRFIIYEGICKIIHLRHLTAVCKAWRSDFGLDDNYTGELHHSDMGQFMQRCINRWVMKRFKECIIHYKNPQSNKVINLYVCDILSNFEYTKGTFDLSICGDTGKHLVVTTNIDRFYTVEGENKDKRVILITPRYWVENYCKNASNHPASMILAHGNADQAPVIIAWRQGNETDLTLVDSLVTQSMKQISASPNLNLNWCSVNKKMNFDNHMSQFHVWFLNPSKCMMCYPSKYPWNPRKNPRTG